MLPGLVLWLDSGQGVVTGADGAVTRWNDRSGRANDAVEAAPASAYSMPKGPGGSMVVELPGGQTQLAIKRGNDTSDFGFGTGELLIEVVARWVRGGTTPILFETESSTTLDVALALEDSGNVQAFGATTDTGSSTTALQEGTFYLFGMRRTGTGDAATLEVRIDGAVEWTKTGATEAHTLGTLASAQVGPGGVLDVAEVVVVKGPIAAAALAALESHLLSKYGLR
jgi:hypothetical protein